MYIYKELNIDATLKPYLKELVLDIGTQYVFGFSNGYGAFVTRNHRTYGNEFGLWEVAVLGRDGNLNYDTPVTEDVIGWCGDMEVNEALKQISELN
jgi:hypothetical protein